MQPKTFKLQAMKRTPKGVYCELEAVDGRGWLNIYLDDPTDLLSFETAYDVSLSDSKPFSGPIKDVPERAGGGEELKAKKPAEWPEGFVPVIEM